MAKNEQVRIDLEAKDDASKVVDQLADKVEALEDADPKVTVTADDQATDDIKQVADQVERLSLADAEIILKARSDQARAELKAVQAELKQTGEQADETNRQLDRVSGGGGGPNVRGNAIADLTGPLGEASGAASDFAGVFDGLGDIAEATAGKLGASSAQAAQMAGAIGGLGIAVAAGAAVWSLWNKRQDDARKKLEATTEAQKKLTAAMAEADAAAATAAFHERFKDAEAAAKRAGIPLQEYVRFLLGYTSALPTLSAQQREMNEAIEATPNPTLKMQGAKQTLDTIAETLTKARGEYLTTNQAIHATAEENAALALVMGLTGKSADDTADALGDLADDADDADRKLGGVSTAGRRAAESMGALTGELDRMRGALDMQRALQSFEDQFRTAMEKATEETGLTEADILDLKTAILDVATFAGLTPVQVESLMKRVDNGDMQTVLDAVQLYYDAHQVVIRSKLDRPGQIVAGGAGGGAGPTAAAATVVNVSMPVGSRGVDVLRQVSGQARRSGRRYGTPVVHFARR